MIASFWQAIPWATNAQVVQFVKQSADRYTTPDAQYGYGIPDFGLALSIALLKNQTIKSNDFIIAPNPTATILSVYLPAGSDKATLSLYTTLGQVVANQNITAPISNVSLEGLNSGVYFYKLESNSLSQSGKIIKE